MSKDPDQVLGLHQRNDQAFQELKQTPRPLYRPIDRRETSANDLSCEQLIRSETTEKEMRGRRIESESQSSETPGSRTTSEAPDGEACAF